MAALGKHTRCPALRSYWQRSIYVWIKIVLLFYDQLITISDEVNLVWSRRMNIGNILFLFMRYMTLVSKILSLATMFWWPGQSDEVIRSMLTPVCSHWASAIFSDVCAALLSRCLHETHTSPWYRCVFPTVLGEVTLSLAYIAVAGKRELMLLRSNEVTSMFASNSLFFSSYLRYMGEGLATSFSCIVRLPHYPNQQSGEPY